ncbi:MAG: DUF4407 domain-containing protein [Acidobacteria bacterium]|nr:DUF4407 domain-containing protein [Acidobacteriota bacterium]
MFTQPENRSKSKFGSVCSFKPFGTNLLTDKAAGWFRTVFVLVCIMAATEAISWGYIGSTFFTGVMGYVCAVLVGCFMFCLVFATDATLMTLDRANPSYEQQLYGEKRDKMSQAKAIGAVVARIAIVFGSMLVTAPFVTQMIFSRDIKRQIEFDNNAVITETRTTIESRHNDKINEVEKSLNEQRDLHVKEVGAWVGSVTGKRGDGPTAKAIQKRIESIENDLQVLKSARKTELDSFEMALKENNYSELKNRWGLILADSSPLTRGEMIKKIESTPGFRRTEIAIQSLLAFLFVSLLILKFFQSRSVKIYLSEALQDEWLRYKAGAFNGWLEAGDNSRAQPCSMTPFRFEDMMTHVYPIQREMFLSRAGEEVSKQEALNDSQELLQIKEGLRHDLEGRIGDSRDAMAAIDQKIKAAATEHESVLSDVEAKEADLEKYTCEYKEFERIFMTDGDSHQPVSPRMKRVLERLASSADHAQLQMEEAQKGMAALKERAASGRAALGALRAERETLRNRLADDLATLDAVQDEIIAIKVHRLDEIKAKRQKGYGSESRAEAASESARRRQA